MTVILAPSRSIVSPAPSTRTGTPRPAARTSRSTKKSDSSSPLERQNSRTGRSSRTTKRPRAWSGCGWVRTAASCDVTPVEIERASAVHEDGVPAPAQKQGISLPHVEGLEPKPARRPRWARPQGENEEENARAQESRGSETPGSEGADGRERGDREDRGEGRSRPQECGAGGPFSEKLHRARSQREEVNERLRSRAGGVEEQQSRAERDHPSEKRDRQRGRQPGAGRHDVEPPEEDRRGRRLRREGCGEPGEELARPLGQARADER